MNIERIDNPLHFFQDLIENDGKDRLFNEFYNSTGDYFRAFDNYDEIDESFLVSEFDEEGVPIEKKYSFKDNLSKIIRIEYYKANVSIDEILFNLSGNEQKEKAGTFVQIINYYQNLVYSNNYLSKYDVIKKALDKLSNGISGKYLGISGNEDSENIKSEQKSSKKATGRQIVIIFQALLENANAEKNATKKAELIAFITGKEPNAFRGLFSDLGDTDKVDIINSDKEIIKTFFEKLNITNPLYKL
jgi:hypothetical protein